MRSSSLHGNGNSAGSRNPLSGLKSTGERFFDGIAGIVGDADVFGTDLILDGRGELKSSQNFGSACSASVFSVALTCSAVSLPLYT